MIYLLAGIIRARFSKAKPELVLVGLSFIVMIAVGVLAHSSANARGQVKVQTGDITQQGSQNAAGVGGSVSQSAPPCNAPEASRK